MSDIRDEVSRKINKVKDALDRSSIYNYRENLNDALDKAKDELERDLSLIYRDGLDDLNKDNPWLLWAVGAAGVLFGLAIGILF